MGNHFPEGASMELALDGGKRFLKIANKSEKIGKTHKKITKNRKKSQKIVKIAKKRKKSQKNVKNRKKS